MFDKINYKEKRVIIVFILMLLFFATYKKLYKNTFNTVNTYNQLKNKKLDSVQLKNDIVILKKDLNNINIILGNNIDDNLIQQNILNFASEQSKTLNTNIVSLGKQHVYKTNDVRIYSNFLELEGSYNTILKTIYTFEKEFQKSKINSVHFYIKKNYTAKKQKLYAKILFQNFKKEQ